MNQVLAITWLQNTRFLMRREACSRAWCLWHEVNELDWKARLSENSSRLAEHLIAFGNHPGGGTLVFGVDDGGRLIDLSAPTKVKAPMYG
jgi:hypothetical protein